MVFARSSCIRVLLAGRTRATKWYYQGAMYALTVKSGGRGDDCFINTGEEGAGLRDPGIPGKKTNPLFEFRKMLHKALIGFQRFGMKVVRRAQG